MSSLNPDPEIDWLLGTPPEEADQTELVSSGELASWLGLTTSRVGQLARDGYLPRVEMLRGYGHPLKESVRAYAEYLRGRAQSRSADPALAAEKLRLASETADKLAIQNAKARGELIPAAEVRAEWLNVVADLRSRIMAVPGRVSAKMGLERATAAALDAEMRSTLTTLAETSNTPLEAVL